MVLSLFILSSFSYPSLGYYPSFNPSLFVCSSYFSSLGRHPRFYLSLVGCLLCFSSFWWVFPWIWAYARDATFSLLNFSHFFSLNACEIYDTFWLAVLSPYQLQTLWNSVDKKLSFESRKKILSIIILQSMDSNLM